MANNNIFAEFDKMVDTKALAEEVKNTSDNNTYEDVPDGTYEVQIEKMEPGKTKTGKPKITVWFKILSGNYKGQRLFMNQVIETAFQIHSMKNFLKSLKLDKEIEFESYVQFGDLVMDIMEEIDGNFEYGLKYYHKKNSEFGTFEITEVFELE